MKRRSTWWERRLDALNRTRRQHQTVARLIRNLLAERPSGAVYRTTRGTCAALHDESVARRVFGA